MKARLCICLLLASVTAASAAKPGKEKKTMSAPVEEWKSQQGGPSEPGHALVTDAKGWKSLAAQLGLNAASPDFSKSVVVAVYAGEQPTGGFSVLFDEPAAKGDDLVVRWRIKKPSSGGFVTQAFTKPWKARVFPRPKGKVLVEFVAE